MSNSPKISSSLSPSDGGGPFWAISSLNSCRFFSSTSAMRLSRSEEHTSELQSRGHLVCRLLHESAATATYTLSLHDALPILTLPARTHRCQSRRCPLRPCLDVEQPEDLILAQPQRRRRTVLGDQFVEQLPFLFQHLRDAALEIGRAHV